MGDKRGAGDLRMEDILNINESKATKLFRNRFTRYKKLVQEMGDKAALEVMMEKYPQQQKALMGTFIDRETLAEGFTKAVPLLGLMGFTTEVVDISQNGIDAALEIQRVCPFLKLAKEYGFATPCEVFCEMEQEAARRAFPGLKASILSKQAEKACVCVFKYERPARQVTTTSQSTPSIFAKAIALIKLTPTLMRVGIEMLKMRLSNYVSKENFK
jgi:hypothetical protein